MCGIAGIYRFDSKPVDTQLLHRMTDAIAHRGPDDEGHYVNQCVGLGNRRLSIIDLSPRGNQPMSNETQTVWLTYNGEIYNYKSLRADLVRRGHRFRSDTDTEVIVHLYEEEGVDCLKHLNGMFSFALWDSEARLMFLARDRLGIKPLFYYVDREKLLFGSEIKCILCDSTVARNVNIEALHHYLSLNYTVAPLTLFDGIRQLLPGHYLVVENGRVSDREYWDLEFDERNVQEDMPFYQERLEQQLHKTVERMVVSDVPFGVFLSGGLDSSAITYYMSQILPGPVKSFSIGFEEESYDELKFARLMARHCHTEHHELVIKLDHLEDLISKLVWHMGEPLADASLIPVYHVSKLAREHVKMVLCGDGGDEILAGYETYTAYHVARLYRKLPTFLRQRFIAPLVNRLPVSDRKISFDYKAKRFVRGAEQPPERAHFYWRIIFDEADKARLFEDGLRKSLAGLDAFDSTFGPYFQKANAQKVLNRLLYVDTRVYLPNDMLVKVDRMSMANSLEVRVPFLDHELVEFLATVPPSLKLKNYTNKKYLLKHAVSEKIPSEILCRKKRGFNIPVGIWIRTGLKDFVLDVMSNRAVRQMGYFKPDYIRQILAEHFERKRDYGYEVWGLLTFFIWHRQFIEQGGESL